MVEGLHFSKQVFYDCWDHSINMYIRAILHRLRTLHGMGFSGARLAVCKNGAVISFESLVDHGIDFALFIKIFLGGVSIKQIIEVKFSESVRLFPNVDLMFFFVDLDQGVFESLFFLCRKEGTNSDCGFNFARHLIKK